MKNYCGHDSPFLVLSDSDGKQQIIFLRMNLTFEILVRVSETKWFMMSRDITAKLTDNGDFSLTFVQNIETSKWIFYFNGKEISNQPIGKANFGKVWTFSVLLKRSDDNCIAISFYLQIRWQKRRILFWRGLLSL